MRTTRSTICRHAGDTASVPEFAGTIAYQELREVADCDLPLEREPTAGRAVETMLSAK